MINVAVSLKATFLLRAIIRHVSAEDTDRNKRHIYIHNRAGAQAEITSIG